MHTRLLSTLVIAISLTAPALADNHRRTVTASAGGGKYTVVSASGDLAEMEFGYGAVVATNGRARGQLFQVGTFQGETIEFLGEVTCLAVDAVNHRAWIGGVITKNRSTHPTYRDSVWAQPGEDIWFRVLDADPLQTGEPDRTTFVGFEGAIPSSEAYCRDRIWPDGNARTWPVLGNVVVKP